MGSIVPQRHSGRFSRDEQRTHLRHSTEIDNININRLSLTVKAVTLIFISGRRSPILSAKQWKS